MRTLVETGVLVGERGAYHLAQSLLTMQMPMTVQAVLATRIDCLPPAEKRLLHMGAVIGIEYPCRCCSIAALPEATVHDGLGISRRPSSSTRPSSSRSTPTPSSTR